MAQDIITLSVANSRANDSVTADASEVSVPQGMGRANVKKETSLGRPDAYR